jgi:polyphosphate glucokinase
MARKAIGIDIGGTGIKGALVDTKNGRLLSSRIKLETPEGGEPEAIATVVGEIVKQLTNRSDRNIGICFPAVVENGITRSAANISKRWINLDAQSLFTSALHSKVEILNDADAAGLAESHFGAGKGKRGLVITTTLGTGIGTALIYNGTLVPNSELGHIIIDGYDYETKASFAAKERENLSFEQWAERLQKYYSELERLLTPSLFIVGGGVSKSHKEFLPLIKIKTPLVPARLKNSAGIIGAATQANREY